MIFDSHIHIDTAESSNQISDFKQIIKEKKLGVLVNAENEVEYNALAGIEDANISFGIHPWKSDKFCCKSQYEKEVVSPNIEIMKRVESLREYYIKADAVGEIGMDSVWCQCDLDLQKHLFISQLDIAKELNKPVVLHIKGKEKEASDILRKYPMNKLVHWYSCEEHLDELIKQDCYFTVGPNFSTSKAVRNVMERVPLERLLVETDGISAVEWAIAKKIQARDIVEFLKGTLIGIATVKNVSYTIVEQKVEDNFYRFMDK